MKTNIAFLLIAIACEITAFSQTPKIPCPMYPEVTDNFIRIPGREKVWHDYSVTTELINLDEYPDARPDRVFEIMLTSMKFIAPSAPEVAVEDCSKHVLMPGVPGIRFESPILVKVNWSNRSITNFTFPGHPLHAGKVDRQIKQQGNKVFVRTVGVGNNAGKLSAEVNDDQTAMNYLWNGVTDLLRAAVKSQCPRINLNSPLAFLAVLKPDGSSSDDVLLHPKTKPRIMKLVGTHFGFMQKIRSLGGPMSDALADTTRTEFMCKAHECAWEGYFIVCDINRNNILVGIRHDGKEFMFSEDGTNHPKMTEWINKH